MISFFTGGPLILGVYCWPVGFPAPLKILLRKWPKPAPTPALVSWCWAAGLGSLWTWMLGFSAVLRGYVFAIKKKRAYMDMCCISRHVLRLFMLYSDRNGTLPCLLPLFRCFLPVIPRIRSVYALIAFPITQRHHLEAVKICFACSRLQRGSCLCFLCCNC